MVWITDLRINMKYRIIQDEMLFVPQYRSFFFWRNFDKIREFLGLTYYSKEAFLNLAQARAFIDDKINEKAAKKLKPIIYPHS